MAVAGLVLLVVPVASAQAQDTVLTRLRHRADSLLALWRDASELANVADSLERERATAGRDTIAYRGLRIIANPSPLPLRAAAEQAWPVIAALYGSWSAELARHPYIIRAVDPDPRVRRPVLHVGLEVPWDLDVPATTNVLIASVPVPALDRALSRWLNGALRPSPRAQRERTEVYLQLVTAPSTAVRACFLGAIDRCRDVLELRDSMDVIQAWYGTPAERRALVLQGFGDYFARGATAPALHQCRAEDDAACTTLLRSLRAGTLPRPLGFAARATLVREALAAGGPDAYRRLVGDTAASIATRLARASGQPVDTLVAHWLATVVSARPARLTMPWWAVIAACGWTAIFGCCALRSSRWRL